MKYLESSIIINSLFFFAAESQIITFFLIEEIKYTGIYRLVFYSRNMTNVINKILLDF